MTSGLGNSIHASSAGRKRQLTKHKRHIKVSLVRSIAPSLLGLAGVAAVALALLLILRPPPARAAGTTTAPGDLYAQHCASCHQVTGLGIEGAFPPLAGNPAAADQAYVESVIRDGLSGPIEVLGVSYDAVMPPVAALTDADEISEVARYVAGLADSGTDSPVDGEGAGAGDGDGEEADEAAATTEDDQEAGPIIGDVDRGHDLFVGASRFDNGGAACAGCHTAGAIGNLGGWSLGPDLTGVTERLGGEAGLAGWLVNPPSPVMQPVFAERPLNEAELADVVAFLGDEAGEPEPTTVDALSVAGAGGLVLLIAGMALAWRGMRQTYVQKLRGKR